MSTHDASEALHWLYGQQDAALNDIRSGLLESGMKLWEEACSTARGRVGDEEIARLNDAFLKAISAPIEKDTSLIKEEDREDKVYDDDKDSDYDSDEANRLRWVHQNTKLGGGPFSRKQTMKENLRSVGRSATGVLPPTRRVNTNKTEDINVGIARRSTTDAGFDARMPQSGSISPTVHSRGQSGQVPVRAKMSAKPPHRRVASDEVTAAKSKQATRMQPRQVKSRDGNDQVHHNGILPSSYTDEECASLRIGALLGSKADRSTNKVWFDKLAATAHKFVYGPNRELWAHPKQRTRIAVLDSGVSFDGAMSSYKDKIMDRQDFTVDPPIRDISKDENGHGTAVIYQVIQTCPSAHIYVGKVVARQGSKYDIADVDRPSVAKAIIRAAEPSEPKGSTGWGVDIINLSFGWNEADLPSRQNPGSFSNPPTIAEAIAYARSRGVLIFASATNSGLSEANDILYPARDKSVISVDAEDGQGNVADFAQRSMSGSVSDRFCGPGLGAANPLARDKPLNGSSFASPVAAGIAALVLDFARQKPLAHSPSVMRELKTPEGMTLVLRAMADQTAGSTSGFRCLYPWKLFNYQEGVVNLREEAALQIVKRLQSSYGTKEVGSEIEWGLTYRVKTEGKSS